MRMKVVHDSGLKGKGFDTLFPASQGLHEFLKADILARIYHQNRQTRATATCRTSTSVNVRVCRPRDLIVKHVAQTVDIKTARGNVCGNQHTFLACPKSLNELETLTLLHRRMQSDNWDSQNLENMRQAAKHRDGIDENHSAFLERFQEVVQVQIFAVIWAPKVRLVNFRHDSRLRCHREDMGVLLANAELIQHGQERVGVGCSNDRLARFEVFPLVVRLQRQRRTGDEGHDSVILSRGRRHFDGPWPVLSKTLGSR
mmetsp:Transcript_19990/g.23008  ORF Transcript_19990/g.23008 Transcript_19990/m.23008 type:complete len:257 (+) Transcript_19990:380-1150(+)